MFISGLKRRTDKGYRRTINGKVGRIAFKAPCINDTVTITDIRMHNFYRPRITEEIRRICTCSIWLEIKSSKIKLLDNLRV